MRVVKTKIYNPNELTSSDWQAPEPDHNKNLKTGSRTDSQIATEKRVFKEMGYKPGIVSRSVYWYCAGRDPI